MVEVLIYFIVIGLINSIQLCTMHRTFKLVLILSVEFLVVAAAFSEGFLKDVDVEVHSCEHTLKPILITNPTRNDMIDACDIKIIDNPVSVLKANMFSGLDRLLKIKFENSSTEEVEPHFLNNTANLVIVAITRNHISIIKNNIFSNTNIKYLWLNFNRITTIETNAFDNMTDLVLLDLGYNLLKTIDGQWFRNNTNLRRISFVHNSLAQIGQDCLQNLKRGEFLTIILSYNQISEIHPEAFKHLLEIRRIEFQKNQISQIPDEFFRKFHRLWQLNLNRNNISCIVEDVEVLKPVQNLFLKGNQLKRDCVKKLLLFMRSNTNFIQLENWEHFNYLD